MFNYFKKKPKFGSPEHYEQELGMSETEYWQKRWDDSLKDKDIVKRYVVYFGFGHYGDFCGVKEITGYYSKTYKPYDDNKSYEENWKQDVDIFYQIDKDDSHSKHGHKPEFCFETKEAALKAYNEYVYLYIKPLQTRIDALNAARSL